ncbi:hypothetical protein VFC49_05400 [Thermococcus sp. SY098]|uniref:hypothetical protein n=1 Tax=Thermococcus sp. SY098 TaxID=3111325 RepID=UPI002D786588|nr:hypothetical protein [Thermococcus sp. SY098]WRS53534.1 hypothetical protein VFC49_05400 [Thermococcus sp. SY098]
MRFTNSAIGQQCILTFVLENVRFLYWGMIKMELFERLFFRSVLLIVIDIVGAFGCNILTEFGTNNLVVQQIHSQWELTIKPQSTDLKNKNIKRGKLPLLSAK